MPSLKNSAAAICSSVIIASGMIASLEAQTLFDPFTDGALVGGADASNIAWWDRSTQTSISIVDDSLGLGTGNALKMDLINGQIDRPVLGVFNAITLAEGDQLTLSFDFRYEIAPTANSADIFRFGFYNSNGTSAASEGSSNSDNDFGYQVTLGSNNNGIGGFDIKQENINSGAGGLGSGSGDRFTLSPLVNSRAQLSDILKHVATFTLTRTATGMDFSASFDGVLLGTATDTTTPYTTFDQVVFAHGTTDEYFLDNVQIIRSVVPEPSTALLACAGVAGLLSRRRRK